MVVNGSLMDLNDVIVHVFYYADHEFYNLENYERCTTVNIRVKTNELSKICLCISTQVMDQQSYDDGCLDYAVRSFSHSAKRPFVKCGTSACGMV